MACACSVFSFAMVVRLLISYLSLPRRSLSDSPKSSATSAEDAPESEPRGDHEDIATLHGECEDDTSMVGECYVECSQ